MELRTAPPRFLVLAEGPWRLVQVAIGDELVEAGDGTGAGASGGPWWAVELVVSGPAGSPYGRDRQGHRARITVDRGWPRTPPLSARFVSAIDHIHVDAEDSGEIRLPLGQLFASAVATRAAAGAASGGGASVLSQAPARHSLRAGAARIHLALGGPLQQLPPEAEKERLAFANAHVRRTASAVAYAPWRSHFAFFAGAWDDEWLDPRFRAALLLEEEAAEARTVQKGWGARGGKRELTAPAACASPAGADLRRLATEVVPGVFEVPMLAPGFRALLASEIERFLLLAPRLLGAGGARQPNNQHRYGAILADIGLEPLMVAFLKRALAPLGRALYPVEGAQLDGQHSFFVRYRHDQDTHLDNHHDDSDVTFSVALDLNGVDGTEVQLCGLMGAPDHRHWRVAYRPRPGFALVHLGRLRHGVSLLRKGERRGLVVWGRSSAWRRAGQGTYQREVNPPDPRCLSYTHDVDYTEYRSYPPGGAEAARGAWCPPPGFAHKNGGGVSMGS